MQIAAVLLALAALGGITIAGLRLSGTPRPPTWMALGHGLVAASGVLSLLYAVATQTVPVLALWSLAMFIIAALGGVTIFLLFHLREQPLPIPLVLGHGAIAVVAYVLLLMAMFT